MKKPTELLHYSSDLPNTNTDHMNTKWGGRKLEGECHRTFSNFLNLAVNAKSEI